MNIKPIGGVRGVTLCFSTDENKHSEVDVPLTYADYYFLEALLRWKSLK